VSNPPVTLMLQAAESMPGEPYQGLGLCGDSPLCAGACVDRSFRDLATRKIHNNSARRITPSYGFDLVPVMRRAWRSWYLAPGLQVAIVGCLVLGSRLAGALVVCVIFVCLMLRVAARIIAETFRAQVPTVAEYWFERRKFRIRPETPGSPFLTTRARGIRASTSNSRLRSSLDPTIARNLIQRFDYHGD
jgi:hypothetical protein